MDSFLITQIILLLLSLYYILKILRKMPKAINIAVWSFLGVATIVIVLMGFYYPENLQEWNDNIKEFNSSLKGYS